MKVQKRVGQFETNSSSTHTLCIPREMEDVNIPSEVMFQRGHFDRTNLDFDSINAKLSYVYEMVIFADWWEESIERYNQERKTKHQLQKRSFEGTYCDQLTKILASWGVRALYVPEVQDTSREDAHAMVKGFDYSRFVIYGIDHAETWYDSGILTDMFEQPQLLYNFLFSPKSLIQTGESGCRDYMESDDEFVVLEKRD